MPIYCLHPVLKAWAELGGGVPLLGITHLQGGNPHLLLFHAFFILILLLYVRVSCLHVYLCTTRRRSQTP